MASKHGATDSTGICSSTEMEKIASKDLLGNAFIPGRKYSRTIFTFGKCST